MQQACSQLVKTMHTSRLRMIFQMRYDLLIVSVSFAKGCGGGVPMWTTLWLGSIIFLWGGEGIIVLWQGTSARVHRVQSPLCLCETPAFDGTLPIVVVEATTPTGGMWSHL